MEVMTKKFKVISLPYSVPIFLDIIYISFA